MSLMRLSLFAVVLVLAGCGGAVTEPGSDTAQQENAPAPEAEPRDALGCRTLAVRCDSRGYFKYLYCCKSDGTNCRTSWTYHGVCPA